ncbi:DUF948 domain-containing protein [Paenibacillus sacheonensis]|uniref:DUF948 domain-containing protein n=1 Tax=Paenibacillus sacheonensis TaxID=742054 RepID=A0A7X4YK68_9BACL|nr:DUF948 domain-containing protein [Paenibacillus sacheonensis]MBM7563837.1 uncharacterized protein YoxC [Paenibacillus sacheonensis]NBC67813.1 DUF948 domain-containing protein [Paenibacillus sacheonensis]
MVIWFEGAAAVAFVALVVGVLLWLRSVDRRMGKLMQLAESLERRAEVAVAQVSDLLDPVTETVRTVQKSMDGITKLTEATKRIGESANQFSFTVNRISSELNDTVNRVASKSGDKAKRNIADAMGWAEVGYAVWHFWKDKRKEDTAAEALHAKAVN